MARFLLGIPFFIWVSLLLVFPFLLVVHTSFLSMDSLGIVTPGFTVAAFSQLFDLVYLEVFLRTFSLAITSTFLTILMAFPVSFHLSRMPRQKAGQILAFIMIPFWTNYLIRLLAFMDVLRLNFFSLDLTYSFPGMVLAMVYNYLPFAILPLYSSLEKIPNSYIEAAQDLGATGFGVFRFVVAPIMARPVASVSLLVFIPALGEFLVPEIIGGSRSYYLGSFLQQQFLVTRNWPLGSAAVTCLMLFSVLLLWIFRKGFLDSLEEQSV